MKKIRENRRYRGYVIYMWGDEYRAIRNGRTSFDFADKTLNGIKKKIKNER